MFAVDAQDLTKTFRSGWLGRRHKEALRGASLQVPRGAIFGLLGPNGAGKTTLLSILATLLLPDSGTATILGHDIVREAGAIRRLLNMASGNASFVWSLRPPEVLTFYGGLYGLCGRRLRSRVDELIEQCELGPHVKTEYNALSTGLKQRLALAKALLNDPEVLFLDEPTLGLDPDVSIRLRAQIAALRRDRGTTIILTTHYMREAEELCDQIAFIKDGRILAQGTADELKRQIRIGDVIALRLDPATPQGLSGLPGVLQVQARGEYIEYTVDALDKRLPEILRWLHEQGVLVRDCQVREPELEEVFVELARCRSPEGAAPRDLVRGGGPHLGLRPPQCDHGAAQCVLRLRAHLLARGGHALARPPHALSRPRCEDDGLHPRGHGGAVHHSGLPARRRLCGALRHLVEVDEAPVLDAHRHPAHGHRLVAGGGGARRDGLRAHGHDRHLGVPLRLHGRGPGLADVVSPGLLPLLAHHRAPRLQSRPPLRHAGRDLGLGGRQLHRHALGHLLPGLRPPGLGAGRGRGHSAHVLPRRLPTGLWLRAALRACLAQGLRAHRDLCRARARGAGFGRHPLAPHRASPQTFGVTP